MNEIQPRCHCRIFKTNQSILLVRNHLRYCHGGSGGDTRDTREVLSRKCNVALKLIKYLTQLIEENIVNKFFMGEHKWLAHQGFSQSPLVIDTFVWSSYSLARGSCCCVLHTRQLHC